MIHQRGFTLVELSIVLVILGLLIGGVLTGQSLIRAAELRSVATQQGRYVTAVQTFRDKYFALPGDMTNATSYWGAADGSTGNTAACATTASTDTKTCNGNGDGQIVSSGASIEWFRFWQHLANAGLIEGSYDGITHGTTTFSATTANSPAGRISSSLWYAVNMGQLASDTTRFNGTYGNALEFGGVQLNTEPVGSVLKPEEAFNIDTKIDDGKPATGSIVARPNTTTTWASQTCSDATASTTLTANYLLSNTALSCALIFRNQF